MSQVTFHTGNSGNNDHDDHDHNDMAHGSGSLKSLLSVSMSARGCAWVFLGACEM